MKYLSKIMSQGTISVLFGCHSFVHSLYVLLAWKRVYKNWPKLWEVGCIILHDIGHVGTQYLDNYEEKKRHWKLGARLAGRLFGRRGFDLVAGHTPYSKVRRSKMYLADKHSWLLAPKWWLWTNLFFEPGLAPPDEWKRIVRKHIDEDGNKPLHEHYLRRNKIEKGDYGK